MQQNISVSLLILDLNTDFSTMIKQKTQTNRNPLTRLLSVAHWWTHLPSFQEEEEVREDVEEHQERDRQRARKTDPVCFIWH